VLPDDLNLFPGLGFIQFTIEPANPRRNLARLTSGLQSVDGAGPALIVLPEMWSCGFAYGRLDEMAAETAGLLRQLAVLAGRHHCLLAGSLPEKVGGDLLYNTLYIIGANGVLGSYRKQRIFAYGGEGEAFAAGEAVPPVVTPWGRIGCLVCYDLRFPELARSQCQQGADLLICAAEWPAERIEQWRILLRARAIENQTFLVACNACGLIDAVDMGGRSAVIDPEGNVLAEAAGNTLALVIQPDWRRREDFRSRFSSVAVSSSCRSDLKIIHSAVSCLEMLTLRKKLGQRLICCEITGPFQADLLDALQAARGMGDFLLVLLRAETAAAGRRRMIGSDDWRGESQGILAALACVDAVCSADDFTDQESARLEELVAMVKIAG
jgi:predicted amidohydrolase